MKKRPRKKKHWREFAQSGCQLIVTRNRKDGFDAFLYAFVDEAIEQSGCYCRGGGKENELNVIVELGTRSDNPEAKLKEVTTYLDARPDVKTWQIGEEFDLWYGDVVDMQEETESGKGDP